MMPRWCCTMLPSGIVLSINKYRKFLKHAHLSKISFMDIKTLFLTYFSDAPCTFATDLFSDQLWHLKFHYSLLKKIEWIRNTTLFISCRLLWNGAMSIICTSLENGHHSCLKLKVKIIRTIFKAMCLEFCVDDHFFCSLSLLALVLFLKISSCGYMWKFSFCLVFRFLLQFPYFSLLKFMDVLNHLLPGEICIAIASTLKGLLAWSSCSEIYWLLEFKIILNWALIHISNPNKRINLHLASMFHVQKIWNISHYCYFSLDRSCIIFYWRDKYNSYNVDHFCYL